MHYGISIVLLLAQSTSRYAVYLFTFCPEIDLTFLYYEPSRVNVETLNQLQNLWILFLLTGNKKCQHIGESNREKLFSR